MTIREASTKCIIGGEVFFYRQKAPFQVSGHSVRGALEYDATEDKIRCHECGEWFESVGHHALHGHDITAREYKLRHGLKLQAALVNEAGRKALSARALAMRAMGQLRNLDEAQVNGRGSYSRPHYESANESRRCHAQILSRIRELATRLGHTPRVKDLRAAGLHTSSIYRAFNLRSLRPVMLLVGLQPNERCGVVGRKGYSHATLVQILRDFRAMHGRTPRGTDFKRKLLPRRETFIRCFGDWPSALHAAGAL